MDMVIPKPILQSFEKLSNLIDKYPIDIPITVAADFLGMDAECLRCSIEQGRATFGVSWKREIRGKRGFKIPTIAFFNWITQGHTALFIHEYTEGKN